jgi:hypothetical protein
VKRQPGQILVIWLKRKNSKVLNLLEVTGDRHVAALLSMNPMRKLLILLEPKFSSLRGAKRRGNLKLPRVKGLGVSDNANLAEKFIFFEREFEATGDRHVAALLAMARCQGSWPHPSMRQPYNKHAMTRESRFMVTPKYASAIQQARDDEVSRLMATPKYALAIQQARDNEVIKVHGHTQICVSHTTSSR